MKLFHYSTFNGWDEMISFPKRVGKEPKIKGRRRLGQEDKRAWNQLGLFCLFSPKPDEWVNNKEFPKAWNELKRNVGPMLIEVDVDENDPNVFVVDWGHREAFLWGSVDKFLETTRREAEAAYIETKISLKDYLARKDVLHYSLPEVIVIGDIPIERFNVSEFQPLLEERLTEEAGTISEEWKIQDIMKIPELRTWYQKYRSEHNNEHKRRLR